VEAEGARAEADLARARNEAEALRILERVIRGRFVDNRFTAQAELPARPCSLQLSREPTAARPGS
jgi:hypothetical protein